MTETSNAPYECIRCRNRFTDYQRLYCTDCCARDPKAREAEVNRHRYWSRPLTGPAATPPAPPPVVHPPDPPRPTGPVVVVRGKRKVYHAVASRAWGVRHVDGEDPTGVEVDEGAIVVHADFPRLPAPIFNAILRLYRHFLAPDGGPQQAPDSTSEVSVMLCRSEPDLRTWRAFVARQQVSGARVAADQRDIVDLLTGERFPGVPDGWRHVGSTHSHNRMGAFFSSVDDANELTFPGIHFVIGQLTDGDDGMYASIASVVQQQRRYSVPFAAVVDATPDATTFHPTVLEYVTKSAPPELARLVEADDERRRENSRSFTLSHGQGDIFDSLDELDGFRRYRTGRSYVDNLQDWLNTPGASLTPRRERHAKRTAPAVYPNVADAIETARALSAKLPTGDRNAVRAFCNAIERCSRSEAATSLIEMVAGEVSWGADDLAAGGGK